MPEKNRFFRGLVSLAGYSTKVITFERQPRVAGTTKYNYKNMIALSLDGITSLTTIPLKVATYAGLFALFISVVLTIWIIISKLNGASSNG